MNSKTTKTALIKHCAEESHWFDFQNPVISTNEPNLEMIYIKKEKDSINKHTAVGGLSAIYDYLIDRAE